MGGGGGDPAAYQKAESKAQLKFEREQEAYYKKNFLPIEKDLADQDNFNISKNIRKSMLDFETAKPIYQEKAEEQKSRYLGGFGLNTDPNQMSGRQRSLLDDQKIYDATMEAGIRQGIRQGVTVESQMKKQQAISIGQGYNADVIQGFQRNAAFARTRDAYTQQANQAQGAMIGGALGIASGVAGFNAGGGFGGSGGSTSGGGASGGWGTNTFDSNANLPINNGMTYKPLGF